jgi:hypothetical protein
MEGEGVTRVCKEIGDNGYKFTSVSHDNDASSMAQILDKFPDCIEKLDVGHAAKNICKKVKELGRSGHKALVGFGEKVKRRFQQLAHQSEGDLQVFKEGLDIAIEHWCGDHSRCTHTTITGKTYKPLQKESEAVKVLQELFENVKKHAHKFASGTSSNICEAVNNEITVYAPKRYNLADSYEWRANLAMLVHNEGPEVKSEIIKRMHLVVPKKAVESLVRRGKSKIYFQQRKRQQGLKSKRAELKEKKRKRGKKIENEQHTYKGGHTPGDEEDEDSLLRDSKAKRVRKESDKCSCKSVEACKNNKCSCRTFDKKCNDKCKCKDKCKNM